jgi:hypothetical protein
MRTNPQDGERSKCGASTQQNRHNAVSLLIALISDHFQPRRQHLIAGQSCAILQTRFQTWDEVTGVEQAA